MKSVLLVTSVLALAALVLGHGYMSDPPNRASLWRFDYNTPPNYEDNEYFCGGFHIQHEVYGGKCGECGDNYGDPRPRSNENGGYYGRGIVTRTYRAGQEINVKVEVTANHDGWFQFSLCKLYSPTELEQELCFAMSRLQLADGSGTKYVLPHSNVGTFTTKLKLPAGVTCDRCVLQWHYNAGNSWGMCSNGTGAVGCGHQETFRSCSDIAIVP